MFHVDVAKVDRDVVCYNGCTRMLQASFPIVSSVFPTHVANVFIWMLHMFHTYIASVLYGCCVCFAMVLSVFPVFWKMF